MSRRFILIAPSSRGLSLALAQHYLRTTRLPVFATHRSKTPDTIRQRIMAPFSEGEVDKSRLNLLEMELTSEQSIANAAETMADILRSTNSEPSYLDTAFFTGGILYPERQPPDLNIEQIQETFQINVVSHLLLIKHFSPFLPPSLKSNKSSASIGGSDLAKWVHVSARVGSISDNRLGGWYSYRASKAALNQVIRTFDLHLKTRRIPAICVGVHPGTVKTDLSKSYWGGVAEGKLFEPEYAAACLAGVVGDLSGEDRGKVWDWAGKIVEP
ncbi:NAD(P)-binding domain superfamily protein [Abortiporus biennis]